MIYEYNPGSAARLPAHHRIYLVNKLTELKVTDAESIKILTAIDGADLDKMCREPLLYPYLSRAYPQEEYVESLLTARTLESLLELNRLGYFGPYFNDTSKYYRDSDLPEEEDKAGYAKLCVLLNNSHLYDRQLYIHFERLGNTRFMENIAAETHLLNSDLMDYLTEPGKPLYDEARQQLAIDTAPGNHSELERHRYPHEAIRCMIRKYPNSRILYKEVAHRMMDLWNGTLQYQGELDTAYFILIELAKVGHTQSKDWVEENSFKFGDSPLSVEAHLTIPGTSPVAERLEAYAALVHDEVIFHGENKIDSSYTWIFDEMEILASRAARNYVPSEYVLSCFLIPGRQELPFNLTNAQIGSYFQSTSAYVSSWLDKIVDRTKRLEIRKSLR